MKREWHRKFLSSIVHNHTKIYLDYYSIYSFHSSKLCSIKICVIWTLDINLNSEGKKIRPQSPQMSSIRLGHRSRTKIHFQHWSSEQYQNLRYCALITNQTHLLIKSFFNETSHQQLKSPRCSHHLISNQVDIMLRNTQKSVSLKKHRRNKNTITSNPETKFFVRTRYTNFSQPCYFSQLFWSHYLQK